MNPLGLCDLNRQIRPVGQAYKQLISDWQQVLPAQSVCLQVPIIMPSESDQPWAQQKKADAKQARQHVINSVSKTNQSDT